MVGAELFVSTDDNDLGQHSPTTGTVWRVSLTTGVAVAVARDLGRPRGLAALPDGRLVLADYVHHVVSLLDPTTGQVTALAGARDQAGYVDGTGAAARFDGAYDVAVLPDGRIAVSDFNNHRVRAVTLAGVVTTLAGTGTAGHADGAASTATFGHPQALASDAGDRRDLGRHRRQLARDRRGVDRGVDRRVHHRVHAGVDRQRRVDRAIIATAAASARHQRREERDQAGLRHHGSLWVETTARSSILSDCIGRAATGVRLRSALGPGAQRRGKACGAPPSARSRRAVLGRQRVHARAGLPGRVLGLLTAAQPTPARRVRGS